MNLTLMNDATGKVCLNGLPIEMLGAVSDVSRSRCVWGLACSLPIVRAVVEKLYLLRVFAVMTAVMSNLFVLLRAT